MKENLEYIIYEGEQLDFHREIICLEILESRPIYYDAANFLLIDMMNRYQVTHDEMDHNFKLYKEHYKW